MPTTNPVPSLTPGDMLFNVGALDQLINGTVLSFVDRLGRTRVTAEGFSQQMVVKVSEVETKRGQAYNQIDTIVASTQPQIDAVLAGLTAEVAITETAQNRAAVAAGLVRVLAAETTTVLTRDQAIAATNARPSVPAAMADGTIPDGQSFSAPLADGSFQAYMKVSSTVATPFGQPFISTASLDAVRALISAGKNGGGIRAKDPGGNVFFDMGVDGRMQTVAFEVTAGGEIKTAVAQLVANASGIFRVRDPGGWIALQASAPVVAAAVGPNYGGQISALKAALSDPLFQFLALVINADSIGWGMTASGIAPIAPRNHLLTDTRNNGTSPTWVNLLHQYLGTEYYGSAVTATPWPASPGGVAQFEYTRTVDLYPGAEPFAPGSTGRGWIGVGNGGAALGVYFEIFLAALTDSANLKFVTTGYGFSLVFAAMAAGASYQLYVDDMLEGTYSTDAGTLGIAAGFGQVRAHTFATFKRAARVELRVVPSATGVTLRLEAVRIARKLRVTNQGVIGVNTDEYRTLLLNDAVRSDDSFALVQLGTNDRVLPATGGVPKNLAPLYLKHRALLDALDAKGVQSIVLCANAATDGITDMLEVRAAINRSARDAKKDFIDQYALTRPTAAVAGNLADGLHPADPFHLAMFNNIRNRIEGIY